MSTHVFITRVDDLIDQNIQVILFDLDGTLRHHRPDSTHALIEIAAANGVRDTIDNRREAYRWAHHYWAQSPELSQDRQKYDGQEEAFWQNYIQRSLVALRCNPKIAVELTPQIYQYFSEEYEPEDWVPDDVPLTLNSLRSAGYRLGLLSNRSEPCDEHLEQLGLKDFFEEVLVAGQVNSWKPDEKIFQVILDRMQISASAAIYIGDNYYADVIGAQRAGIQPILFDPNEVFPEADCLVIKSIGEIDRFLL